MFSDFFDFAQNACGMSMCRIDYERISACIKQCGRTFKRVARNADCSCSQKATMLVFCSIREFNDLFDILDRDKTNKLTFGIDQRKLFNLVLLQDFFCLFQ